MQPFADDIDQVVLNAKGAGVKYLHSICTRLEELDGILELTQRHDNIYSSVGVHPDNAKKDTIPSVEELIKLSKHPKIISFGETGLDYYHEGQEPPAQKTSFVNHINAASSEKLPVIAHTREAENDTIEILTSEMKNAEFSGIIHCFTASYEFAKKAIDIGLYISIAGIVTFKNAKDLQETVAKLPLDRLLIETDAPYLAPMPHRGKRNEPAYVKHTAEYLATLFGKSFEEVQEITTQNAKDVFAKADFK